MALTTPPNPYRFAQHVPDLRAATLEEAGQGLTERMGPGTEQAFGDGLVAVEHRGEDRYVRLIRDADARLIGIQSGPTQVVQAFFRPCSGYANTVTGTGMVTGNVLFLQTLITSAQATAVVNWGRLYAMLPNPCMAPCKFLPVTTPNASGLSITVTSRFLGLPVTVTVTADATAQMWCV